jgi:hypothetical protein
MREFVTLGGGCRPRALDGGRATEDVLGGGRATDMLGGGRLIGEFSGSRFAGPLERDDCSDKALGTESRTCPVVGGLTLGRTGTPGLTDVDPTAGDRAAEVGLAVGPVITPTLDVEEGTAGRASVLAALNAALKPTVAFAEVRGCSGLGLSLLESFVRSTISR